MKQKISKRPQTASTTIVHTNLSRLTQKQVQRIQRAIGEFLAKEDILEKGLIHQSYLDYVG